MRVGLHVGQLLQPVPGGIGRYIVHLVRNLPAADVDVVCFGAGTPSARVRALIGDTVDLGWPRGPLRYELWHRLRRPLVRLDVDLVHAPSLAVPPVRDRPLVVTVHDVAFLREPAAFTRRGLSFHQRGLEIAHREAAAIITASRSARDELIDVGFERERIHLAPHGVEVRVPDPPEEIDARLRKLGIGSRFVLSVGTVEPRKGFDTLADAMQLVRRKEPDLVLAVVGPSGWLEVHGLDQPGIVRLGTVDEHSLDALYRRAEVCAIASRYEGFGLPVLEAMACGTPVVTVAEPALVEVAGAAAVVVDDVAGLADGIRLALTERARLSRDGLERARAFTWDAVAAATVRVYVEALGR